jgi:outer membrane receptor protein involved in Fe transport
MLLALFLSLSMAAAAVTGIVKDSTGGAVSGASVVVMTPTGVEQQTVTGPDGRFTIDRQGTEQVTIIVKAGGFAEQALTLEENATSIDITLNPAGVFESVTVTPTRSEQAIGNVPASVSVLDSSEIRQTAAVVADDVLRQLPTFSLFRRTSSIVAHPTAQGVSLRGIGPSGVSRTLVLIDDVPFNDPFGGWVYWTRVPMDNVDRIEVVEGPNSSLYGNYGMGGVINIVSARASQQTVEVRPQFGNFDTRKADFFGSHVYKKFSASLNGSWMDTNGFPLVAEQERGPIDKNAWVTYRNWNAKADYTFGPKANVFFRVGDFNENRNNAKITTTSSPGIEEVNDTSWLTTATGVRVMLPDSSSLQARVFTDNAEFHSNFLAVPNPNRTIARRTLDQIVPTRAVGTMVQWGRAFGLKNYVSAGLDTRWVEGESQETGFDATLGLTENLRRNAGGTQRSMGAYVQDILSPIEKLTITLSARVDNWKNYNGHNYEVTLPSGATAPGNLPPFADRDDTVVSPKAAAIYHFTDRVSAWGSFNKGFRAPTLNELYRQFRVGAILTQANSDLGPERLTGGELGVNLLPMDGLSMRVVYYDNRIENPVSNVTIATNIQQRQNLGRTKVAGLQTEGDLRVGEQWRVSAGYVYNQAKVTEFSANEALVNNCQGVAGASCFLPQVPEHRGSFRVTYMNPRIVTLSLGYQYVGLQYDDDQNVRGVITNGCSGTTACANPGLPAFSMLDMTASRAFGRNFEAYFGVQNLADTVYFVQTNPSTVGTPRMVTGGVRVRFSR